MSLPNFFQPDVLLENNDTVNLGNTCIRCVSTPGHTAGTLSFFFDVYDGKKTLRAGMHGGVGMNSMNQAYLKRMNLPLDMPVKFLYGLELLQKEHLDIFIGNHVGNNDTVGKAEILNMLREQEEEGKTRELTAVCRFCSTEYTFTEKELL